MLRKGNEENCVEIESYSTLAFTKLLYNRTQRANCHRRLQESAIDKQSQKSTQERRFKHQFSTSEAQNRTSQTSRRRFQGIEMFRYSCLALLATFFAGLTETGHSSWLYKILCGSRALSQNIIGLRFPCTAWSLGPNIILPPINECIQSRPEPTIP